MITALVVGYLLLSLIATIAVVSACILSGRIERAYEGPKSDRQPRRQLRPSGFRRIVRVPSPVHE